MTLSATTVWEIETGGSDSANGGGFDPGTTGLTSDLAATNANTASPVVTSASYTFVASDVGDWVFIQSGTNWIPGWYKIASVSGGAATLTASVNSAVLYQYGIPKIRNSSVGCASVASPTGGVWTIDYSQQSSGIALTGLSNGAASATVSSTSAKVSWLGNVVQITGGTNFTTGFYNIISVVAGTSFTVDRNATTAAGSAGTAGVGGALASIGKAAAIYVGGNQMWVQNGTYTITSQITFSTAGADNLQTLLAGYGTVRHDGVQPLVTTATNNVNIFFVSGANCLTIKTLHMTCTAVTKSYGVRTNNLSSFIIADCVIDGFLNAINGISGIRQQVISNCTLINSTSHGLIVTNSISSTIVMNCWICNNAGSGVFMTAGSSILVSFNNCVIAGNGDRGIYSPNNSTAQDNFQLFSCTIANNTADGIYMSNATQTANTTALGDYLVGRNNLFYGNGGYGIAGQVATGNQNIYTYNLFNGNAFGSNTSGNYLNIMPGNADVTITVNPFNNAGGGDFSLNTAANGGASLRMAASPGTFGSGTTTGYLDFGAVQNKNGLIKIGMQGGFQA